MNVFSIGFVVMIALLGGVIALIADNLGRTLGKKRLSLKGIRPRRTAQIFTFGAGALIPMLTIGVVFLLSADVRRWFVEGPAVLGERDRLSKEVTDNRKTLDAQEGRLESLDKDIQEKAAQAQDLAKRLKDSQAKLASAKADVTRLNGLLGPLNARLKRAQSDYQRLTAANQGLQKQNAAFQARLTRARDEYEALQKTYGELNEQKADAERYQIQLQNENVQLEREKTNLQQELDRLKSQTDDLSADLNAAQSRFDTQQAANARAMELANMEIDKRKGELQRLQEQLDILGGVWFNSRTLPMIYAKGEEIARVTVPANLSRADAANHLARLLRGARSEAEDRGAKSKGAMAAAGIVERIVDGRAISPEVQQQRILDRLTGLSEPFVILASSSFNAFQGEPVSLEIQTLRNPVVFTSGELVAETRIDGDRTENVLFDQIEAFIRTVVREKARSGGMIPAMGQEATYGELGTDTLLDLIRTAKANNRRVRLQAWAPKDIRAGDSLDLEYRIR